MSSFTSPMAQPTLLIRPSFAAFSTEPVYGLSRRQRKRTGGVKCSMEKKQAKQESSSTTGASTVAVMLTAVMSSPAMALVDERMSTEGTGLPFGLSNNLLGWILLGVFGLIWTLYFTYTSSLDEDDDSGLSL